MIKVTVGVPSTGMWKPRMGHDLVNLSCQTMVDGISISVLREENSGVSDARNRLVLGALQQEASHLLFIDTDMGFPHDAVKRMVAHDKEIVGTAVRRRLPPFELIGKWDDEGVDGLHEAQMLGTGFIMINTSVFKKVDPPWFYETYFWDRRSDINLGGRVSEDYNFIFNARKAGVRAYVDLNLSMEIVHIGDIEVGIHKKEIK